MGIFDFLKGKPNKKPTDIIKALSSSLDHIQSPDTRPGMMLNVTDMECNELESYLAASCVGVTANVYIKKQPKPEDIEKCISAAQDTSLLVKIAIKAPFLPPETRRIVSAIWGYFLKIENPKSFQRPMVEFLISHTEAIEALITSYGTNVNGADVIVGVMIRDACRYAKIVQYVLEKDLIFNIIPVLSSGNFDVSADAFQTLRELLTNHKDISAPWLAKNFLRFFEGYMKPLSNPGETEYVTVRQSLSILSTLLLDRQFMESMIQFVNNDDFLKIILILMGNESKVVKFEAFHIFKIFAANPSKTSRVSRLLNQNHDRVVKLLDQIESDRLDDNEFRQDKAAVVAKLESLHRVQAQSIPKSNG
jgi:calcium binding protein 39